MFSAIRKRATYANVAMTLALVFAMTGGAYAAKKYLITSTKQISPSVLKQLVGKTGAAGASGANGKDGAAGPQGPQGPAGANGKDGTDGKEGPAGPKGATGATGAKGTNGTNGATGPEGNPWTAGGTLPEGRTETGGWSAAGVEINEEETVAPRTTISFPIPLKAGIAGENVQHNPVGFPTGATAEEEEHCPGSAAEPKAASGFLCVYTTKLAGSGVPFPIVETLTSTRLGIAFGASASGALIFLITAGPEKEGEEVRVEGWGSWAVTG